MISVGIDVSKGKSTVCIMKPCGEILESPFDIGHTADELDSLISLIKSFDEETRVVMEDTGHYHLPVATYLSSHNIFVCCVNALRMKKFCSQSTISLSNIQAPPDFSRRPSPFFNVTIA